MADPVPMVTGTVAQGSAWSPPDLRYAPPDEPLVGGFIDAAPYERDAAAVDRLAAELISAVRGESHPIGDIDDLLHAFGLSTREGLALMALAEALLRIPDNATADKLIEDKLAAIEGGRRDGPAPLLVSASSWGLGVAQKLVRRDDAPEAALMSWISRAGPAAVRSATRQAMCLLGRHFVFGQGIREALRRREHGSRYSFDMLGEGARTQADADRYFESYAQAIEAVGAKSRSRGLPDRAGISVKLSALHPRYVAAQADRVAAELLPRLAELARLAKSHDLNLTVDAEEADRLELSLTVIAPLIADPALAGWDGFGLAVQAYQKRAPALIDWLIGAARARRRRLMIRLVKGAYWDTEIKRAQERGLDDYPVFTRKAATDLCYLACARKLFDARPTLYPQLATHNALSIAQIIDMAGGDAGWELQRLHGMAEPLYRAVRALRPNVPVRVYAPVGSHEDLLAYLVRRLLENGANASFVSAIADTAVPVAALLRRPQTIIGVPERARHGKLSRPRRLYGPNRLNSAGLEFGCRAQLDPLRRAGRRPLTGLAATSLLVVPESDGGVRERVSPVMAAPALGTVREAGPATAAAVMVASLAAQPAWQAVTAADRARMLETAAGLMEQRRDRLIALLAREAGKTLDDGIAEIREAVDFCRYYADQGRRLFAGRAMLPGPVGEENTLSYRGRGPFVCISPWNFPLAIFVGQVSAALMAGNCVVAKPAGQTPLIAAEAVRILHEAGIPPEVLQLILGGGTVGAGLVAHPACAGVAFTGSTATARAINRALSAGDGPMVPLIAETGGLNAMIVDASALPEQVTDDVIVSAFRSAGQRCSALRLLFVQEDIADRLLTMLCGATRELVLGDPADPATDIGPIIDAEARVRLRAHVDRMRRQARILFDGDTELSVPETGTYLPPFIVELARAGELRQEVFGPILHVVRWRSDGFEKVLSAIADTGYGLTLGVHSRVGEVCDRVAAVAAVGNVYINRNIIGAVVGVQPFGGMGLSGTGPKAGGPDYLRRFAVEQTVSTNIAAAGGDVRLMSLDDRSGRPSGVASM